MQKLTLILLAVVFLASCQDDEPHTSIVSFSPGAGNYGDQVTITGNNFSPQAFENAVKFGNVEAEVVSATATEVVVLVPVGAMTGKISVAGQSGTAQTSTDFAVTSGSWRKIADAPFYGERGNVLSFTIGQSAYLCRGEHAPIGGATEPAGVWQYNQTTGGWSQKTPIATDYDQSFAAMSWSSSNGKGYLVEPWGGKMYEYNPGTDSWTEKAGLVTPEIAQYNMVSAFGVGTDGYVLLGNLKLYKYSTANNSWSQVVVSVPANTVGVILSGEKVYFLTATPKLYEFIPGTSTFEEKATPPVGVGVNPEILQGTSQSAFAGNAFDLLPFWEYNVTGNKWIQKASFIGEQRYSPVTFYVGSKAYVGLGAKISNDALVRDVFEYSLE